ncbi:hypothetical protein AAHA92_22021 [Salvia divinorum]|uniref:Aspartic peptidase DDI1-type domain-containing protein n=1 Tax=Salvia divinorum TaxID=28513 RepID=A0ABD1GMB6_SALDI
MQASNDVVHKLQDAQLEQKGAMDMMAEQLSQIATSLNEMKGNNGKIPGTVKMPGSENISKITLRSGRAYDEPKMRTGEGEDGLVKQTGQAGNSYDLRKEDLLKPLPQMVDPFFLDEEQEVASKENEEDQEKEVPPESSNRGAPQMKPFPYLGGAKKKKEDPVDFMEIFGKLEINLPFLQALELPPFSRFIKEFIAGKAQSDGKIVIRENISAVIQKRKLPSKRTDPGIFTLPITIGDVKEEHAMCDLGASINVLPLSMYKKLRGAKMVDTKVVIQLADRSCISPEGVLENVIVKIHDFLYPADFHVIRMSESKAAGTSGVLLGRPFLRTAKTIIDIFDGTICLDYHGEKYTFNIDEAMKKPMDVENLHSVDVIAPLVQEYLETELMEN